MIWVELLGRHREVVERVRCDAIPIRIGRAYDNDVVVEDPYVAAHHLRVARDDHGALFAEDVGSANGLFVDGGARRVERCPLTGERILRIGRTQVRIRDASFAVAPERIARAQIRAWPLVGALGATVLCLELLGLWLGETSEPQVSRYVVLVLVVSVLVLGWATAWALLSRLFSGNARFDRHLAIALAGLLTILLFDDFIDYSAFALSWRWLAERAYVGFWLLLAGLCYFHLREIGPSRLKLKGAAVAALAAIGIATQSLAQAEMGSKIGQRTYLRQLQPPMLRLAAPQTDAAFFDDVMKLKRTLDQARTKESPSGGLFSSFDLDE